MRKPATQKIVVAVVILQAIATVIVFAFIINYFINPNSEFGVRLSATIKEYVEAISVPTGPKGESGQTIVGAQGPKGDKGDTVAGPQGPAGLNGIGQQGAPGESATPEQIAAAVSQYLQQYPPAQGLPGNDGQRGEVATFSCNPETKRLEYKYPSDETPASTGAACAPIGEENEQ